MQILTKKKTYKICYSVIFNYIIDHILLPLKLCKFSRVKHEYQQKEFCSTKYNLAYLIIIQITISSFKITLILPKETRNVNQKYRKEYNSITIAYNIRLYMVILNFILSSLQISIHETQNHILISDCPLTYSPFYKMRY